MNINIGKYNITSDSTCFTLSTISKIKAGDKTKKENIGKERKNNIGYYPTMESLMNALPDKVLLNSEATNLRDAILEVKDLYQKILTAIRGEK